MKLFINCVASYPDGLSEEDLSDLREDVEDCLVYRGVTQGWDVQIETKVEA